MLVKVIEPYPRSNGAPELILAKYILSSFQLYVFRIIS